MPAKIDIDKALLFAAIRESKVIPTSSTLGAHFGVSGRTMKRRLTSPFEQAMEERAVALVTAMSDDALQEKFSTSGWMTKLPLAAQTVVYDRIDSLIEAAIERSTEVPTAIGLSRDSKIKISRTVIQSCIVSNPVLLQKMREKAISLVKELTDQELVDKYTEDGWVSGLPSYAKKAADEKMDKLIEAETDKLEGVPTPTTLADASDLLSAYIVAVRTSENSALKKKMEARGKEWLDGLPMEELVERYSHRSWMSGLPDYAQKIVYGRIDSLILDAIEKFEGIPTERSLVATFEHPVSRTAFQNRLTANSEIWVAYHVKRGLTRDQALELAVGNEDPSFLKALNKRIRHLSAFREMLGVLKCFREIKDKAVACISLYPNPLGKAAEDLGLELESSHIQMAAFRNGNSPEIPAVDAIVAHSIHRLSPQAITAMFRRIRESENHDAKVIATYGTSYILSDAFLQALSTNGFICDERGMVSLSPPDDEVLRSHGVTGDNLARVKRKVSERFNVLVLSMNGSRDVADVPALEKAPSFADTRGVSPGEGAEADVPEGLSTGIHAKFLANAKVLPSAPFLVEVHDRGQPVALLGYDMDPDVRNRVETATYSGAPAEDFRGMARRLAQNLSRRTALKVRPGRENRLSLERCKKELRK